MAKTNNKNSPEKQAAQHLANLLGRDVSGFEPQRTPQSIKDDQKAEQILAELLSGKRKEEGFDIEKCLSDHLVWPYDTHLPFIIIAYILREEDTRSTKLFQEIDPDIFNNKFARFLFLRIKELRQENEFNIDCVQNSIENCGQEVFGHELSPIYKLSYYRIWFKTLATYPTVQQFDLTLSKLRENQARFER
jgi:hypothetical protein